MQFKGYSQNVGGATVMVQDGDEQYELPGYHDEVNHSPDGFQWGYRGSGPAQLAFAILAEAYTVEFAHEHYQSFKKHFVAQLDGDEDFLLSKGEMDEYFQRLKVAV